jgi:hypothetical protein
LIARPIFDSKIIITTLVLVVIGFISVAESFTEEIETVQAKKSSSPSLSSSGDTLIDGARDGKAQAMIDERNGIDDATCGKEHSNDYCIGYEGAYIAEHVKS